MITELKIIVHICLRDEWQVAVVSGRYQPPSLESEGFIHFSKPDQVLKVANTFYSGVCNLVLLWIKPEKLVNDLRWEKSDGEIYPHLYGPLNLDAVMTMTDFLPDRDGVYRKLPIMQWDKSKR